MHAAWSALPVAACARRSPPRLRRRLAAVLLCALGLIARAGMAQAAVDELSVSVERRDDWVIVDAGFAVDAPLHVAWSVLTDFEHMARFIGALQTSEVLARNGNQLRVRQVGRAERAGFGFAYESLRDITLSPERLIHSRAVGGTVRQMDATMRLEAREGRTVITYHAESIPGVWVPPLLGKSLIAGQVREQFEDMRAEIQRRHQPQLARNAGQLDPPPAGRP